MTYTPEIKKQLKDGVYYYDKDWLTIEADSDYKAAILQCMSYCKPDMYFNLLYRFLVKFDFEDKSKPVPDTILIEQLYLEAALKILKEQCFIMFNENEPIYSLNWTTQHAAFSNHFDGYLKTLIYYITEKPNIRSVLNLEKSDNSNQHEATTIFIQNVITSSFFIAYNRIHSEIKSLNFFGAEIIPFENKETLNIYLTPFGMANFQIIESWDKDLLLSNVLCY